MVAGDGEATLAACGVSRLLVAWRALRRGLRRGSGDESASPIPPTTDAVSPETAARPKAPPIAGTTLDGDRASLAGLRGRHVFVNVWSSW